MVFEVLVMQSEVGGSESDPDVVIICDAILNKLFIHFFASEEDNGNSI